MIPYFSTRFIFIKQFVFFLYMGPIYNVLWCVQVCVEATLGCGGTVLRCVQGRSGLVLGQDLHADGLTGGGEQLSGFGQRTKLHRLPVDGQDVVACMKSATPAHTHTHIQSFLNLGSSSLANKRVRVRGHAPVCDAGRFDLVDDDDLLAAEHGGRQRHAQTGARRLGNLHQQRPRRRGDRVWWRKERKRTDFERRCPTGFNPGPGFISPFCVIVYTDISSLMIDYNAM